MNLLAIVVVVTNIGFTAWYDTDKRIPVLVEYDLSPEHVVQAKRAPLSFRRDPRVPSDNAASYAATNGYDRGHMAPAADFNWSTNALKETYYFSNVAPQAFRLNRGAWLDTEKTCRDWASKNTSTVHVVVHAMGETCRLPGGVAVPAGFMKIAVGSHGESNVWYFDNDNDNWRINE